MVQTRINKKYSRLSRKNCFMVISLSTFLSMQHLPLHPSIARHRVLKMYLILRWIAVFGLYFQWQCDLPSFSKAHVWFRALRRLRTLHFFEENFWLCLSAAGLRFAPLLRPAAACRLWH